jgi:hypothetical protein
LLVDTGSDPAGTAPTPKAKAPAAKVADGLKADEKGVEVKPAKPDEAKDKAEATKESPPPVKDLKAAIDGAP